MKDKENIGVLRENIDAIDEEVLKLLNKRAEYAVKVGEAKAVDNKKVYVPERERAIYKRLTDLNKGPLPDEAVRNIFCEIISASRSLEKRLEVAFLGPNATFTHQAAMRHFGRAADFRPRNLISEVFDMVERGKADFGVVPVENSTGGVVSDTLDMFIDSELSIYSEVLMKISLCLVSKTGKVKDIKRIVSHPNPISQSRGFVKEHFPAAEIVECSSTAMAAEQASKNKTIAAIASEAAAEIYGLKIIERSIEDARSNLTRFLVIGKKDAGRSGNDKTSLLFTVKDTSGALHRILKPFAEKSINLTKIESRPARKRAWEYVFFLDMDGHILDDNVREAVDKLSALTSFIKILGSYPKAGS